MSIICESGSDSRKVDFPLTNNKGTDPLRTLVKKLAVLFGTGDQDHLMDYID
jgi:hypothetical protein